MEHAVYWGPGPYYPQAKFPEVPKATQMPHALPEVYSLFLTLPSPVAVLHQIDIPVWRL